MKRKLAAALIGLPLLIPAAPGAAQPKPEGESRGPISISADRLETDDETGVANFIGDVMARQGGLTITCDLMKVHYAAAAEAPAAEAPGPESPAAAASREIDRVEGFGQVRMADGDRLATGDHALYLAKSPPRRLILTGNARLWQGRDSLAGQKVTYFIDEKRSLVEGTERRRVRTVVHGGGGANDAPQ